MPDLGRAALVTSLLLLVYALVAGSFAAWRARRRLAVSAQNALIGSFAATVVAAVVLLAAPALPAPRAARGVLAGVVPALGLVGTFFVLLLVFVAHPFSRRVARADGA